MVGAARARGVPVWRVGAGSTGGSLADRFLQHAIGGMAVSVAPDTLVSLLTQT
jgi:hypothetical protein